MNSSNSMNQIDLHTRSMTICTMNKITTGNQSTVKAILLTILVISFFAPCHAAERETGDYNFDGHEDYRVYRESNGKQHYYDFYLFDPRTKKYVHSKELSELPNPMFDVATKEIHCIWPCGHSGSLFGREDYMWEGTRLVLLRVVAQTDIDFKDGQTRYVRVTASIKDGKPFIDSIEPVIKEP